MKSMLFQVFTGGKEICLRISEKQIDKIFKLIVKSEHSGRPELLEMLQAVVKVCYELVHKYILTVVIFKGRRHWSSLETQSNTCHKIF